MAGLHLIVGKDGSYNAALVKRLVMRHAARHDMTDTFEGRSLEPDQLDNAFYTGSLIAGNRAIVINGIESSKPEVVRAIIKFSASVPEHILLIMVSENTEALKRGKLDAINSIQSLKKHVYSDKTTYMLVQEYLKEHPVKITKDAVDMLVNIFELSTWGIIENELDKLSTYAGRNGVIDENAVSELTFNLNKSDTFKFVGEIVSHAEKPALRDIRKIRETGVESPMVIGALAWKLRQLLSSSHDETLIKRLEMLYSHSIAVRKGLLNDSLALDLLTIRLLRGQAY